MSVILKLIHDALDNFTWGFHTYALAAFLVCMLLFLVIQRLQSSSKVSKNPFSKENLRPVAPLETDQKKRDAVLKQGFSSKHIPENLDAIVVGSGMGGMSFACLMANAGKKVLVLEQHDQAGGCHHTFIDKGFEFDVGIHFVGEMEGLTMTKILLDQITAGQMQWESLEQNFENVSIGDMSNPNIYKICTGEENFKNSLISSFPDERENINKIMKLFKDVKRSLTGFTMVKALPYFVSWFLVKTGLVHLFTSYFKYSKMTLEECLSNITKNQELKAVLCYCYGDYATLPDDAPVTMHAVLLQHLIKGAYYPRGGASEYTFHMVPVVERSGGRVLVRAPVSNILLDNSGRAHGVRVRKGGSDFDIFAPVVVSDAGCFNTFTKLLPVAVTKRPEIQNILSYCKHGHAAMSLYIGIDGSAEELGLNSRNVWAFTTSDYHGDLKRYLALPAAEAAETDLPLMFISFPSAKDSTWSKRHPTKTTCTIITLVNYEWFEEWKDEQVMKRGEAYTSLKEAIGERAWQQTIKMFPQVADRRVYFEVGTPLSNQHYIASSRGEVYGIEHSCKRFSPEGALALRNETPVPGLLMTGQDVFCCGSAGAMFAGMLAASKVLGRNCGLDLINFTKKLRKEEKALKKGR